jgi:hypothetical protein
MSEYALKFGHPPTRADITRARREARIVMMRTRYGKGPDGAKCGDCVQFFAKSYSGTYFKCRLYGNSGGRATDWNKSYDACGQFAAQEAR